MCLRSLRLIQRPGFTYMISIIKSPSKVQVSFNRHMDSSLKVIDISIGLIKLFKLDKISF